MIFALYNLALITTAAILGLYVMYTDKKTGKIPNRVIVLGAAIGLLLHGLFFLATVLAGNELGIFGFEPPNAQFFLFLPLNLFLALAVGYFLWSLRVWAAGDAKFFAMLAWLTHPMMFGYVESRYFYSFSILVNIFALAALLMIFKSLLLILKKIAFFAALHGKTDGSLLKKLCLRLKQEGYYYIVRFLLSVVFISTLRGYVAIKFSGAMNVPWASSLAPYILGIVIWIAFSRLSGALSAKGHVIPLTAVIFLFCALVIYYGGITVEHVWYGARVMAVSMIVLVLARNMVEYYINNKDTKKISTENIGEGIVLSDDQTGELKRDGVIELLGQRYAEGLTEEQAIMVKEWAKEKKKDHITVYRQISFSAFLISGYFLSVMIGQSIITLVKRFIL